MAWFCSRCARPFLYKMAGFALSKKQIAQPWINQFILIYSLSDPRKMAVMG